MAKLRYLEAILRTNAPIGLQAKISYGSSGWQVRFFSDVEDWTAVDRSLGKTVTKAVAMGGRHLLRMRKTKVQTPGTAEKAAWLSLQKVLKGDWELSLGLGMDRTPYVLFASRDADWEVVGKAGEHFEAVIPQAIARFHGGMATASGRRLV